MEEDEAMEEGAALVGAALSTCLMLLLKIRDARPSFLTMAGFNLISRRN
jgi:hypothetical protein